MATTLPLMLVLANAHGFNLMVNRRVAIQMGAASLASSTLRGFAMSPPRFLVAPASAAKPSSDEAQLALDRAEAGSGFDTDQVVRGAIRQDLIDIDQIPSCASIDNLMRVDQKAENELRQAIRELNALERASESVALKDGDAIKLKEAASYSQALKDAKVVQSRIVERIAALESAQYARQCIGGSL